MGGDVSAIAALRAEIARLEGFGRDDARRCSSLSCGLAPVDDVLPGGGLVLGAVHEFAGTGLDTEFGAAPALFAGSLAGRMSGPVCWIVADQAPYSPGLAGVGLAAERVIFVRAGAEVLPCLEDCLRCRGLTAVIAEVTGALDLTASRRLQLAAETSGVTALLIRRSRRFDDPALDAPSASLTRWRISPEPSPSVMPERPEVPGVGRARWRLELRRARGRQPHSWLVDAPDRNGHLALASPGRPGDRGRTAA